MRNLTLHRMRTAGRFRCSAQGDLHLVNTHLKPKDAPLSDSTAYWLYACENKGTLVFRTSTRQPDSGLRYMSGNQM